LLAKRNRKVQTPVIQMDQDALDAWGWFRDFARYMFAEEEPAELFAKVTESIRDDVIILTPSFLRRPGDHHGLAAGQHGLRAGSRRGGNSFRYHAITYRFPVLPAAIAMETGWRVAPRFTLRG
jgi:hypothetical protein